MDRSLRLPPDLAGSEPWEDGNEEGASGGEYCVLASTNFLVAEEWEDLVDEDKERLCDCCGASRV